MLVGIWKGSKMCHLYFWDKQVWDNLATKQELTLRNEKVLCFLEISFLRSKTVWHTAKSFLGKWKWLLTNDIIICFWHKSYWSDVTFSLYLIMIYLSLFEIHCHFIFPRRPGNPFPNIFFTPLKSWGKHGSGFQFKPKMMGWLGGSVS